VQNKIGSELLTQSVWTQWPLKSENFEILASGSVFGALQTPNHDPRRDIFLDSGTMAKVIGEREESSA